MKVAAIYDIHGNLPALDAVLAEIRDAKVDRIVVGGDVIPGPMPYETLKRLLELDTPVDFIRGNCEDMVLGLSKDDNSVELADEFREMFQHSVNQIPADTLDIIAGWGETLTIEIDGIGKTLFCHGTPQNNNDIFTRLTPDNVLRPIFENLSVSLVVCGHIHMQFDRTIADVRVVNAGSVGMPYGKAGAYWLLLDSEVQFKHTLYNLVEAGNMVRTTNYPQAHDFADSNILKPPDATQALETFTKMGLK